MIRRMRMGTMVNFRDIGGYQTADGKVTRWGKFYRSDLPANLSEEDKKQLRRMNLTTVIDLRSKEELEREKDQLSEEEKISYYHCPAMGDGRMPNDINDIVQSYLEIALGREQMHQVMQHILEAPQAVLFHCTAGKDRTGVTAALLLSLAGVAHEDIVADYTLTHSYVLQKLEAFTKLYPDIPMHWLVPKAEYMDDFLREMASRYADIRDYYRWLGLSEQEIDRLKAKLTE